MTDKLPKAPPSVTKARARKVAEMMAVFKARQQSIKNEQEKIAFEEKVRKEAIRINEARRLSDQQFDQALERADVALKVQQGKIKRIQKRSLIAKGD
jgi:hypothetical protein